MLIPRKAAILGIEPRGHLPHWVPSLVSLDAYMYVHACHTLWHHVTNTLYSAGINHQFARNMLVSQYTRTEHDGQRPPESSHR